MKKRDVGQKIIDGLNEVLDWNKGKGKIQVTLPGQKPRMMTKEEYDQAKKKE